VKLLFIVVVMTADVELSICMCENLASDVARTMESMKMFGK